MATPPPPSAAGPSPPTSFVSTSPITVSPAIAVAIGAASETSARIVRPDAVETLALTLNFRNISFSVWEEPRHPRHRATPGLPKENVIRRLWLRRLVVDGRRPCDRVGRDARARDVEESQDRLHGAKTDSQKPPRQPRWSAAFAAGAGRR